MEGREDVGGVLARVGEEDAASRVPVCEIGDVVDLDFFFEREGEEKKRNGKRKEMAEVERKRERVVVCRRRRRQPSRWFLFSFALVLISS